MYYICYRFANVAMRMNDPLQTLYQLMSGRQPAAVTVSKLQQQQITTVLQTSSLYIIIVFSHIL